MSTPPQLAARLRSSFAHLRIMRSFHLAPVTLFAISQTADLNLVSALTTLFVLHVFIYPATAGFNSFHDRDTVATGDLLAPPPVDSSLWWLVTLLDVVGVTIALVTVGPLFAGLVLGFVAATRLYSHRATRIKRYPLFGFVWVALFQGAYMYLIVMYGASGGTLALDTMAWPQFLPAAACSLLVAGSFPLSQIYQFVEDAARGDTTTAMALGKRGTFLLAFVALGLSHALFATYFVLSGLVGALVWASVLFLPPGILLVWWFRQVSQDESAASHKNAMRFGRLSAACGNLCFGGLALYNVFL